MPLRSLILTAIALTAWASCTRSPHAGYGQCYRFLSGPDTIRLSYDTSGNTVRGHLEYRLRAKPHPETGPFKGYFRGDTLVGDFRFEHEGKAFTREVTFLRHGKGFREGYGEVHEVDGKLVFVSNFNLRFDPSVLLEPVDCGE